LSSFFCSSWSSSSIHYCPVPWLIIWPFSLPSPHRTGLFPCLLFSAACDTLAYMPYLLPKGKPDPVCRFVKVDDDTKLLLSWFLNRLCCACMPVSFVKEWVVHGDVKWL
jgi:hypothetical protein